MLIDLDETLDRYQVSQSTIQRAITSGTLTKHPHPASKKRYRLSTSQLDQHYSRRAEPTPAPPAEDDNELRPVRREEPVEMFLPAGMAERLVPTPQQLEAALHLALHPQRRLPRLIRRR